MDSPHDVQTSVSVHIIIRSIGIHIIHKGEVLIFSSAHIYIYY